MRRDQDAQGNYGVEDDIPDVPQYRIHDIPDHHQRLSPRIRSEAEYAGGRHSDI